jgi:hypothetical protein
MVMIARDEGWAQISLRVKAVLIVAVHDVLSRDLGEN